MIDKLNIWHKGEIYCPVSEVDNMREQRDRFKTRFLIKDRECSEAVKDLWVVQQERNQLAAQVERLRAACKLGIDMMAANDCGLPKTFETMREALVETPEQSLVEVAAKTVESLRFPVMLRKMWSGKEVQDWIRDVAKNIRTTNKSGVNNVSIHAPVKGATDDGFRRRVTEHEPTGTESRNATPLYTAPPAPAAKVPDALHQRLIDLLCSVGHHGVVVTDEGQEYQIGDREIEEARNLHALLSAAPTPEGGE